jgi:hypothetical protein
MIQLQEIIEKTNNKDLEINKKSKRELLEMVEDETKYFYKEYYKINLFNNGKKNRIKN